MTAQLHYLIGDATSPIGDGQHRTIAHVCNDAGGWGRGFVLAISKRWKGPEAQYRAWSKRTDGSFALGMVTIVSVAPDLSVANMVAQHGYQNATNPVPLDYDALATCLRKLATKVVEHGGSVHMPRIGAGLAGGTWDQIEAIIEATLIAAGVDTYVYDLA
jgi:O-acetyl-ADP-ribose deacetylase (regulator of RNase III)